MTSVARWNIENIVWLKRYVLCKLALLEHILDVNRNNRRLSVHHPHDPGLAQIPVGRLAASETQSRSDRNVLFFWKWIVSGFRNVSHHCKSGLDLRNDQNVAGPESETQHGIIRLPAVDGEKVERELRVSA